MTQDGGKKPTKLEKFKKWHKRTQVYKMIDDGISANQIAKWINDNGFKISTPMVYQLVKDYKANAMKQAQAETMLATDELAKKRAEKKGIKLESYKVNVLKESTNYADTQDMNEEERSIFQQSTQRVKSEMEILDAIIDKAFMTLQNVEALSPDMALKAIKLKKEIAGDDYNGLTMYGIEDIRLREQARENAMITILLEYIPEEKHGEVLDRMEQKTKEFYQSIGLEDAYENAKVIEGE